MHTLALHHFKKESRYNVYLYNRNNYKRRLSSMNSTTPFKKQTIKIPFLSMNFLKAWQPYRTVTYVVLARKEVLF